MQPDVTQHWPILPQCFTVSVKYYWNQALSRRSSWTILSHLCPCVVCFVYPALLSVSGLQPTLKNSNNNKLSLVCVHLFERAKETERQWWSSDLESEWGEGVTVAWKPVNERNKRLISDCDSGLSSKAQINVSLFSSNETWWDDKTTKEICVTCFSHLNYWNYVYEI